MPEYIDLKTPIEKEPEQEIDLNEKKSDSLVDDVVGWAKSRWDVAWASKRRVDVYFYEALRQRKGEYSVEAMEKIKKQGGSRIFMKLTEAKCRSLESWLKDIYMQDTQIPWDIQPTPIPELEKSLEEEIKEKSLMKSIEMFKKAGIIPDPDKKELQEKITRLIEKQNLLKEAKRRAAEMRKIIADQLEEGGFMDAFGGFINDLATYRSAVLKGPFPRKILQLKWDYDTKEPIVKEVIKPCFERVSPFDAFPQPGIEKIPDGYFFERRRITRQDLENFIGLPGYNEKHIRDALKEYDDKALKYWWVIQGEDGIRNLLENKDSMLVTLYKDFIYMLEFWGVVPGKFLKECGVTDIKDEEKGYDACLVLIGNNVVRAVLNYDPLKQVPYQGTSAYKLPGAFWGMALPELIADIQEMCNTAARELQNNMAIASGPQIEINMDRIDQKNFPNEIRARQIWMMTNDPMGNNNNPGVRFFQAESNSVDLMQIYDKFSNEADLITGIPKYIQGDISVEGAGRTSSGLSMLMGAANKGLKQIALYIDNDIIKPIINKLYNWNMRYNDDFNSKGDVKIVAKGVTNLSRDEATQNARRLEFLQYTSNPDDMQLIGLKGRAKLLGEMAKGLEIDDTSIIPNDDEIELMELMNQKMQEEQQAQEAAMIAQGIDPATGQPMSSAPPKKQGGSTAQQMPGPQELNSDGSQQGVSTANPSFK